jgi:hypothetical protein
VPDHALVDELGHGSDGLLDRASGVREVEVVQVDRIGAEASKAVLGGLPYAFGTPIDPDLVAVRS